MGKKFLLVAMAISLALLSTGCWNYRGLNDMTVVAGVAIDKEDGEYKLSFEIYNLQDTATGSPIKSEIIESTGETIFEAVRNAKKRVYNKLYFAQAKIIIVSESVAKQDGIKSIMDWFVRDPEVRENMQLVVSQEKTAEALLKSKNLTSTTVSADIQQIVEKDQKITGSTEDNPLYKIYNILQSEGISLTIPAIHLENNDDKESCELNGIAVFKGDKLKGYLSSEESKYYLLAKGRLDGGIIVVNAKLESENDETKTISLEVRKSSSSRKYISTEKDNLEIDVSTNTEVSVEEIEDQNESMSDKDIKQLEQEAGDIIKERVEDIISKIQNYYDSDILGFGRFMYQTNHKQWSKVKDTFDENFKNIKVNVQSKIVIYNTGYTK